MANSQLADSAQGNNSRIRCIAFFVLALMLIYIFSGALWIPVVLTIDFFFRSFGLGSISPLNVLSGWLVKAFGFPFKPVYLPPKRFAARMGFCFCTLIFILHLAGVTTIIPAVIIAIFAALESLAGFCAGCYVYDYLARLGVIK